MALTNLTSTNQVQVFYPTATSIGISNPAGLLRAANDGDPQASVKIAGGEGGPDWVFTGNSAGAETVTFDAPIASLLKLYAAQQSGVTRLAIKAKIHARSAAVATSDYWELMQIFDDIAGTMTVVLAAGAVAFGVEGAATTDPTLSVSTTNIRVSVTTLAAAAIKVELYVDHAF